MTTTMDRWQFSLRKLFVVTTLLAAICAFAAYYPQLAIMLAIVVVPLVAGRLAAYFMIHLPRVSRWIMSLVGVAWLAMVGYIAVRAYQEGELANWRMWIAVALLCGFGMLFFVITWKLPPKPNGQRQDLDGTD